MYPIGRPISSERPAPNHVFACMDARAGTAPARPGARAA